MYFNCEENLVKWRGTLTNSLKKVLDTVHPSLGAREDALEYVENLCFRLLGMLCNKPSPHSVQEVEFRVQNTFPTPIDKWALKEAQEAVDRGRKKSTLILPVDKIHNLLQKEFLQYKCDQCVSLFLTGVLEYISADILKLAGNYVKHIKHVEITFQDVQISMNADKALMDLFYHENNDLGNKNGQMGTAASSAVGGATYEDVVKELITSEKTYIRELHMLIKVFREELMKLGEQREIDEIFSNIMDLYELTYNLSGSLEDVIEMAQDQMPYIGTCFEELAEAEEFQVYSRYARDVTSDHCKSTLQSLLIRHDRELQHAGHGMRLCLQYYLPSLLIGPIRHCFTYMEYVKILKHLSKNDEDRESLEQCEVMLKPLRCELARLVTPHPPITPRLRRRLAMEKMQELEKIVENWPEIHPQNSQFLTEFLRDDALQKVGGAAASTINHRRCSPTDRRAVLFDGMLLLFKSVKQQQIDDCLKLKEKFFLRKVEILDFENSEELKNCFEILTRQHQSVVLMAKSVEEKNSWMADLVMLNNRSMLERILDSILSDIERKHPLKLPPPELYKFSEPDSPDNIQLEQRENGGVPLIKGATLYKLVERLTYHIYADPKFVKIFLTTFRSFCSPQELLDLLVERFKIPEASLVYAQHASNLSDNSDEKLQKCSMREDWKKYKKEYCQPVQFRVLNVLRHWVDHHFYDFEREPELLKNLEKFLDSVNGKSMRKWVDSVLKIVQRKMEKNDAQCHIKFAFAENPPPIEWHIQNLQEEDFGVLTLHPVELARQLTILEFDLYRMIKPSELVGSVWTKKDKERTSPNLLKMIKHTTNFTIWLEKCIVEASNFEERVAIMNRIIEIMMVLNEMNNFNGVLAIVSATASASVHRLKLTYAALSQQKQRALEEYRTDDHFKKYQEKLRSINPPCVPFLGNYLTNILHIEEGNPDLLPNNLINFFKRRKVAEITGEIQQYQNQPYVYSVEPRIRHFLETLNPFGDMSENDVNNYLYNKSIEIEPRNCKQVPKFPRKFPTLNLKSPGIKMKVPEKIPEKTTTSSSSVKQLIQTTQQLASMAPKASMREEDCDDFSVFANVNLGLTNSPTSPQLWTAQETSNSSHAPPIPPRRLATPPTPQQLKQAPDAPLLPPRETTPPPLPPRTSKLSGFESKLSSNFDSKLPTFDKLSTLPRLHPTTASQLHRRRHSAQQMLLSNGNNTPPPPLPPPSPTTPKLPPKPSTTVAPSTLRSADFHAATKFQYP